MKKSLFKGILAGLSAAALIGGGVINLADYTATPVAYAHGDHDHDHDHGADEGAREDVKLSDWEGSWNSFLYYFDMDEVNTAFEEKAEKDGTSAEEAKEAFTKMSDTEFNYLEITEDKITFYNVEPVAPGEELDDDKKEELASNTYEYVTAHEGEHGGKVFYWYEFNAVEEDAKYPVVLLMDVHGEETMPHSHMRYGDDVEEILAQEDWYPTIVAPETTIGQVVDSINR